MQTASAEEAAVASLLAAGREAGVLLHADLVVRDGKRGRGIFAKSPIPSGEVLVRVPISFAVTPAAVFDELIAAGRCSRLLALALTVLHGLHVAEPQPPYFRMLAASPLPAAPLLWDDAAVALLQGTSLLPGGATAADAAASARTAFETDVLPTMTAVGDYLPAAVRTQRRFAEALSWVMSRALLGRVNYEQAAPHLWPYLRADGPPTAASLLMLPVFDFLNTSSDAADLCAVLERVGDVGGAGGGAIEVRATRAMAAGDEVLLRYGQHGAAELLRTYGIVEERPSPTRRSTFCGRR